jgi:hypothetical protein
MCVCLENKISNNYFICVRVEKVKRRKILSNPPKRDSIMSIVAWRFFVISTSLTCSVLVSANLMFVSSSFFSVSSCFFSVSSSFFSVSSCFFSVSSSFFSVSSCFFYASSSFFFVSCCVSMYSRL